eukprot:2096947-Prymnesium_polylepis.1
MYPGSLCAEFERAIMYHGHQRNSGRAKKFAAKFGGRVRRPGEQQNARSRKHPAATTPRHALAHVPLPVASAPQPT